MGLKNIKLTRRGFLKSTVAAGAAATIGSQFKPELRAFASSGEQPFPKEGKWMPTTCQGCTSWCAIEAYVINGRAIKIRGNANSKVNGKATCPRAHMSLQQVYDPDRLKTPMKRTNPKKGKNEDPKFVPISWDRLLTRWQIK